MAIITCGDAYCQLTPFQDNDAIVKPSFNVSAIRAAKISQITMRYFTKPDGASINDDGRMDQYFFDTAAKITGAMYISQVNNYN